MHLTAWHTYTKSLPHCWGIEIHNQESMHQKLPYTCTYHATNGEVRCGCSVIKRHTHNYRTSQDMHCTYTTHTHTFPSQLVSLTRPKHSFLLSTDGLPTCRPRGLPTNLQNVHENYFTVLSLQQLFDSVDVDNDIMINFVFKKCYDLL